MTVVSCPLWHIGLIDLKGSRYCLLIRFEQHSFLVLLIFRPKLMSTKMVMELIYLRMHLTCHEKKQVDVIFMSISGKIFAASVCLPFNFLDLSSTQFELGT